jgi:bifunctional DNase/RNase
VKVQSLGLDRTSNTPVVILKELEGERVLADLDRSRGGERHRHAAGGHEVLQTAHPRPDLSVLKGMGGRLTRVIITRVTDSTYFAELIVE